VANTGTSQVTGQIILTLGAIEKQIDIVQKTMGYIDSILPTVYVADSGSAIFDINLTADLHCQWAATKDKAWINVLNSSGVGSDTIVVTLNSNSGSQRTGAITIYNSNNPNNYFVVNITQTGDR
jgi:hypothetical protein